MAFRKNDFQQLTINDAFGKLSPRTQKIVKNSWAKDFADIVFPAINEERFAVLYSDNKASRCNTPVNFIIGAFMIKTMFQHTDDDIMESICCDVRYQYALHSTSYDEQPISDRTFSRFRERLYNHQIETGEDLLTDEMKHLTKVYQDFLSLNSNIRRMDSMMIATSAKRMSRLEIIYTVVEKNVLLLHRLGADDLIPKGLEHYLEPDDINAVIYHCKDDDAQSRLDKVINEATLVRKTMDSDEWIEFTEYQLLLRVLSEQTIFDGSGNRIAKPKNEIPSDSLQSPSDPEATFRSKAGKAHKGYVGNIVETVDEDGRSLITDFDFEPNNYTDSAFCKDQIQKHDADDPRLTYIADGAYGGAENVALAEEHNIELVTTALLGTAPNDILADFEYSEDGASITKCPMGYEPDKSKLYKNGTIRVHMSKCHCCNCPHRDECKAKEQRKSYVVNVSVKSSERASYLRKLSTDKYLALTRMRNAVEGIPSVLRRRYNIDHSPFRDLIRNGWAFALSIGAYDFIKVRRYKSMPFIESAQNSALVTV